MFAAALAQAEAELAEKEVTVKELTKRACKKCVMGGWKVVE